MELEMGPKPWERKRDPEDSKKNKKGAIFTVQGNEAEEVVQVIQNQPKK